MRNTLFSWLFLLPLFTALLLGFNIVLVSSQCLSDERSLLLQLRDNLQYNSASSTKLVNWDQSTDCCSWRGVTCDQGGRVIGLDLSSESISNGVDQSSGLFRFQYLQSLNLGNNGFSSMQIPSGLANLTNLRYLNMSYSGFTGQIPIELSQLTRLVTLDLSALNFPGLSSLVLENPNLSMLVQNLSELTELYLDGVNISAHGSEWGGALSSSSTNLRVLSMSNCYLSGPIDSSLEKLRSLSVVRLSQNNISGPVPEFFANLTNLTVLRLSSSNLEGIFPEKILQVSTLQLLDLSTNKLLEGSLPGFDRNASLQTLVLSYTKFSGILPDSIGNLGMLSTIDLANCSFSGPIPFSLANLTRLVYLDFSSNMFTGPIPSFAMSKNLTHLDISHNNLNGSIPSTHFQGLLQLVLADLRFNSFTGNIPSSLFALPSLQKLQLSNNGFDGLIPEFSDGSLSSLDTLDLSSNNLEGAIPTSVFDLQQLNILLLSFNNLTGLINLETFTRLPNLTTLDLSCNSLSINASASQSSLNSFPRITRLSLASCKLQSFLDLRNQSRLSYLDLSDNQIDGEIPNWIWNVGNGTLLHLNLSSNLLVRLQKPYVISSLSVLDLHSNQLSGEIPVPPVSAIYVDYSNNSFDSSMPTDIGNGAAFASFFSLSNNRLTGSIPESLCNASYLQVLDLSNNALSGQIPPCLFEKSSESLGVLNLRNNRLRGNIAGTFPSSCALKTLDLNGNSLDGQVPKSLANCTFLEVLNLGNNNISDGYPCFLKSSANLRVLVLRSNRFQGGIHCGEGTKNSWPNLQIIDLARNNFSGELPPKCFEYWKAMTVDEDKAQSELNHLRFEFLRLNHFYYQDTVTVTNKGLEMELIKILTLFTSIDFSSNSFKGEIPDTVGHLKSLYVLNLSHNALTGPIPTSLGNLSQLGSLDLSTNRLNGNIPEELARLTFLSFLNLSYNLLVGKIPSGSQFQTFSNISFLGNGALCGTPLSNSCNNALVPSAIPNSNETKLVPVTEFNWQFIITGLGFGVGAAITVGPLLFWKKGRIWFDEHMDKLVLSILSALGFTHNVFEYAKEEAPESFEEDSDADGESEDEDEMAEIALRGRYCVFCSKLDTCRKIAIHNPKCNCYGSPLISSSSSVSFSSP